MKTPTRWIGTALLLSLLAAMPARAELIVNGGFESPSLGPAPFATYPPGAPTGWTVVSGSVDVLAPGFWGTPFEASQMLDLDGSTPGVIEQSFATVPGTRYRLSFAYPNTPFGTTPAQAEVRVASGGVVLAHTVTHSTSTAANLGWASFSGTFVASGSTSTLRFTSLSPGTSNGGITPDAVSVQTAAAPPLCDIQLNKASFVNGETVIAQISRFANPAGSPVAVEFKLCFEMPGGTLLGFVRGGADGSIVFPPGLDLNIGPFPLLAVGPDLARGAYTFDCRFLDPLTGELQTEDLNAFTVQ